MDPIKEALTFDDVTLAPQYSKVLPSDVSTKTYLSNQLKLDIPILSSAMDTVTESKMAIALAREGGIGVIHRNLTIAQQIREIKKVKSKNLKVGAAVGTNESEFNRVKNILKHDVDLIVVDTAHGHSQKVAEIILKIKKIKSKKTTLCAGNIATAEAARFLCKLGVDVIKVGIGPGSICTTRLVAGIGVPQLSALLDVKKGLNKKVKIISDGGIKFSGDLIKAIAAGADAIMMGSIFAGTEESPGKKFKIKNKLYKVYRGMGSIGAMSSGSSQRYFQKNYKDKSKFVPEGVESRVLYKGKVSDIIYQLQGGLRSSMGYIGAQYIDDVIKKSRFVKITKAGFYESMVHSVEAIKNSANYKL